MRKAIWTAVILLFLSGMSAANARGVSLADATRQLDREIQRLYGIVAPNQIENLKKILMELKALQKPVVVPNSDELKPDRTEAGRSQETDLRNYLDIVGTFTGDCLWSRADKSVYAGQSSMTITYDHGDIYYVLFKYRALGCGSASLRFFARRQGETLVLTEWFSTDGQEPSLKVGEYNIVDGYFRNIICIMHLSEQGVIWGKLDRYVWRNPKKYPKEEISFTVKAD